MHPETVIWETCTPYFEKRNSTVCFFANGAALCAKAQSTSSLDLKLYIGTMRLRMSAVGDMLSTISERLL